MALEIRKCPNCGARLRFNVSSDKKIKCPRCSVIRMAGDFLPDTPAALKHEERYTPQPKKTTQKTKGKCPECGRNIVIPAGISVGAKLKCPQCAHIGTFMEFTAGAPQEKTVKADRTVVMDPTDLRPGSLVFVSDNGTWDGSKEPIHLRIGSNRIGRRSHTKVVDVSLPTTDDQMSRHHINIEMVKSPGGCIKHFISDAGSKNGTYVNGTLLAPGDEVGLVKGTMIKLGHTVLRFDII